MQSSKCVQLVFKENRVVLFEGRKKQQITFVIYTHGNVKANTCSGDTLCQELSVMDLPNYLELQDDATGY